MTGGYGQVGRAVNAYSCILHGVKFWLRGSEVKKIKNTYPESLLQHDVQIEHHVLRPMKPAAMVSGRLDVEQNTGESALPPFTNISVAIATAPAPGMTGFTLDSA